MTQQEIEQKVKEKYPLSDLEKSGCKTEKFFRDMMRKEYREKLIKQYDTLKNENG